MDGKGKVVGRTGKVVDRPRLTAKRCLWGGVVGGKPKVVDGPICLKNSYGSRITPTGFAPSTGCRLPAPHITVARKASGTSRTFQPYAPCVPPTPHARHGPHSPHGPHVTHESKVLPQKCIVVLGITADSHCWQRGDHGGSNLQFGARIDASTNT